jgi:predicted AAA+ superfamily ATPase
LDLQAFKLYILDVGLLGAMSNLQAQTILLGDSLFQEFKGSLTEQYVLQQLLSEENIWLKRPGGGDFTALYYESLLGKKTLVKVRRGFQIKREDICD